MNNSSSSAHWRSEWRELAPWIWLLAMSATKSKQRGTTIEDAHSAAERAKLRAQIDMALGGVKGSPPPGGTSVRSAFASLVLSTGMLLIVVSLLRW